MSQQPSQSGTPFTAPKKKNKWIGRIILLLILAAVLAVVLMRCRSQGQSAMASLYLPAQVQEREITVAVTGTGTVQPNHTYRATAKVRGEILTAPFAEGDMVEKGDILFTIDPADADSAIQSAQTAVEQAQLAVRSAEINYNSAKKAQSNAGGSSEMKDQVELASISLENAQLSLRTAEDNLRRTQQGLDDYTITSPISGMVVELNYEAGDDLDLTSAAATGASSCLALIYDLSRLSFTLNVDERDIGRVKVGQKVTVTADALDGEAFAGTVDRVSISGSAMSGKTTYPVTVALEGDGLALVEQGLFPGMNVSASIIVEETGPILAVPVDAVTRGNLVQVAGPGALDEAGNLVDALKLEEREVVLGRNDDEYIEILSGLTLGETVYVEVSSQSILGLMMSGRR